MADTPKPYEVSGVSGVTITSKTWTSPVLVTETRSQASDAWEPIIKELRLYGINPVYHIDNDLSRRVLQSWISWTTGELVFATEPLIV